MHKKVTQQQQQQQQIRHNKQTLNIVFLSLFLFWAHKCVLQKVNIRRTQAATAARVYVWVFVRVYVCVSVLSFYECVCVCICSFIFQAS